MTTSTDTRLELDTPFPGADVFSRFLIVDAPVPTNPVEIVKYAEAWPDDRPFEAGWYEELEALELDDEPAELAAPAETDPLEQFELEVAPAAERTREPACAASTSPATGSFFTGGYHDALVSLERASFPAPVEQLQTIRNIPALWSLSENEMHLLMFLASRANGDWLVRAVRGWMADLSRISKDYAKPTLDSLEQKGYLRRLYGPQRKDHLVICLRPIGPNEEGARPERWRPPVNPARKRGRTDSERIKNVSAAIDAAEGRTFDE